MQHQVFSLLFLLTLQFVKTQWETHEMWIIQSLMLLRDIFLYSSVSELHWNISRVSLLTTPHKWTVVKDILQNYVHSHPVKESATIPLTKHNQETSEGQLYLRNMATGFHYFQVLVWLVWMKLLKIYIHNLWHKWLTCTNLKMVMGL